jgi:hypothetical protein
MYKRLRVIAITIVSALATANGARSAPVSAQGAWPFPACPQPLAMSPWSASEAPTRAIAAQQWFTLLKNQSPAIATPRALLTLAANDPVAVCRIPASGPATEGLGATARVALVVVSKAATEEVARYDSNLFEVYLPPGGMADVGPDFRLPNRAK